MSNVRQFSPKPEEQDPKNLTVILLLIFIGSIENFKALPSPVVELIDLLLKIIQNSEGNALPFTLKHDQYKFDLFQN